MTEDTTTPEVEIESLFYSDTVEPELTTPTVETPAEEEPETVEEVTAEEVETEGAETVESEETEQPESQDVDDLELYVSLSEDEEVSLSQIKEWKEGGLRQSDYTKKTQKLADEKRDFEADRDGVVNGIVSSKLESFNDSIAELEVLIKEADDSIDWENLKNYDPDEHIKQKELKDKRQVAVDTAKSLMKEGRKRPAMSQEDTQREQAVLNDKNPQWLDKEGNQTKAHASDMKMLSEYLSNVGFTEKEHKSITTGRDWNILLDAARYNESLKKVSDIKKKVKKILPTTTRPKKSGVKSVVPVEELFYGKS